jgi:hypothetical protein
MGAKQRRLNSLYVASKGLERVNEGQGTILVFRFRVTSALKGLFMTASPNGE